MTTHSQNLKTILVKNYYDLLELLNSLETNIDVIIVEWIFSLFSSVIPMDAQLYFYEGFFIEGWKYFYKVCVTLLLRLDFTKEKYLDSSDIYIALKFGKHDKQRGKDEVAFWKQVCNEAYEVNI